MLRSKKLSRTSNAGLNLIGNSKNVLFGTKLEYLINKSLVKRDNTALTLNEFKHNSTNAVICLSSEVVDVVSLNVDEALNEGEEIVVENVLSRGG